MKLYVTVFIGMLLIVGLEVALTYLRLPTGRLLLALLALAAVEAGLALMYFMHLKYERRLFWSLIPALIFVFIMMNQFWSDAHRLRSLHQ
jgi:heme/copper-type cytochrome/quinol oxidase subunit 4